MITHVKYTKAVNALLKAVGYDPADVVEFHASAGSPMTVHVLKSRQPYRVVIEEVLVQPAKRLPPIGPDTVVDEEFTEQWDAAMKERAEINGD